MHPVTPSSFTSSNPSLFHIRVEDLKAGVMPGYRNPAKKEEIDGSDVAGPSTGPAAGAEEGDGAGDEDMDPPEMCESKLMALLDELHAMREADSTSKALVFSQYK